MPWAFETKMGFIWAIVVAILFVASIPASVAARSVAPFLIPVVAYFAFLGWVNRVK